MTAAKSQSASGTILAVNVEEPALDALAGTFGRSSPPYGLVTAMTDGYLDLHSAPIDDHKWAPLFAISEPDPLNTVKRQQSIRHVSACVPPLLMTCALDAPGPCLKSRNGR